MNIIPCRDCGDTAAFLLPEGWCMPCARDRAKRADIADKIDQEHRYEQPVGLPRVDPWHVEDSE